eukprot:TRINITY_DN22561_c0_g1_i1.p1 TRINITY_DN22561_c0_g1~~TRINITY_DN22561_c0_g1_i1.p1  ORF type:complete len:106 (+),score=16.46 TRINITY_DN22561_c0_g1_i1:102-419(+)
MLHPLPPHQLILLLLYHHHHLAISLRQSAVAHSFCLMLSSNLSLAQYITYAHFKRQGYIILKTSISTNSVTESDASSTSATSTHPAPSLSSSSSSNQPKTICCRS